TALVLAVAAQAIWGTVVSWVDGVRSSLLPRVETNESLEILRDGTPVVQISSYRGNRDWHRSWRTIDGAPLVELPGPERYGAPSWLNGVPNARSAATRLTTWPLRIRGFAVDTARGAEFGESWYAISDRDGRTYFVGYDTLSSRIVGHFGRSGFRES